MTTDIHVYGSVLMPALGPDIQTKHDIRCIELADEAALIAALPDIEFLYGFLLPKGHWSKATKLRMIQSAGAGVDTVLPAPDLSEDVLITNASGAHEPHMPEFVIAQMLGLAYRMPLHAVRQTEHQWRRSFPLMSLEGRRLCVVGLGTIGQSIARRAKALGMTVTGVRRSGAPVDGIELVSTMADRIEALSGADVVAIVTPLTEETHGFVGAQELAALNKGSIVVDVSRGGVTNMTDLVAALDSGQVAAASVDVFEEEPLPADSTLWDVPNLLVTPHAAGLSSDYLANLVDILVSNVRAVLAGETPPTLVDRNAGY